MKLQSVILMKLPLRQQDRKSTPDAAAFRNHSQTRQSSDGSLAFESVELFACLANEQDAFIFPVRV
jgi:hypothetical protein